MRHPTKLARAPLYLAMMTALYQWVAEAKRG